MAFDGGELKSKSLVVFDTYIGANNCGPEDLRETKKKAIIILESCGFNAEIGLRVLEQKSFITISDTDGVHFHGHIEEMGRDIIVDENGYREWKVDEVSPYLPDALRSLYWFLIRLGSLTSDGQI
ncbi:hypothetical protein QVD17_00266 [Tagetes erecta]|uniref:Disease resistance protein Roq1-like winged-helix domain-containing protein n=1 Tax=Tagetes erecta TaxID=13708 RepID=A0AAD8P784_TARER|nr:hypothetical protein QVD17_00266 [Tagetes erecta]